MIKMDAGKVFQMLLDGFGVTVGIFFVTLVCSIPLGLIFSIIQRSKIKPIRWLMDIIIWIVRGTPLMLQVIAIYYGPGLLGVELPMDEYSAVYIAFSINYGCYFSVIFKGGMDAVPKGQYEACQLLGMTKVQTFRYVVLPQVYKNVLPATSNETINLVKDTSLANIIGLGELVFQGKLLLSLGYITPFFATGLFYLVFIGILTIIFKQLEKRVNRYS